MKKTVWIAAVIAIAGTTVWAQEHAEEGHHGHKHHVALFVGNTHNYHSEDALTVGLGYEYRLTELLGVGALIDYAGGDIEATVAAGGVFIHPWRDLRLLAALGNEHHAGSDEFLTRLGVMYDFFFDDWSISPELYVDLLESGNEDWIYGVALGRGF
jgi:hypothetical protein